MQAVKLAVLMSSFFTDVAFPMRSKLVLKSTFAKHKNCIDILA